MELVVYADNLEPQDVADRKPHRGARAVIEREGEGCLLHLSKLDRYTLPGGGIKRDEEPLDAVFREVREETGLIPTEAVPTVLIREHFPDSSWEHHFFKVRVEPGTPNPQELTAEERALGLEAAFVPLDTALAKLSREVDDPITAQIHKRELMGLMHSLDDS